MSCKANRTREPLRWHECQRGTHSVCATYFGQPILFISASGRSRASRAAAGNGMPLGTSQISTRRFLASLVSEMAAPRRSVGAVAEIVHDVGNDSVSWVAPTQLPLMREASNAEQVPVPPLSTAAV